MKRDLAQRIMLDIRGLSAALNKIAASIELIDTDAERKDYRRACAELMGDGYSKIMRPIIRQFPDLDPDK